MPYMIFSSGISAKELKEIKDSGDDNKVVEILKEATSQEYFLKIMSKIDNYNGEKKIRHQAVRLQPINYVNESKEILKILETYNKLSIE